MEETFEHLLDLLNIGIAITILVLAIRIGSAVRLAIHRKSILLFCTAAALFAFYEVLEFLGHYLDSSEEFDLLKETVETAFILILMAGMYMAVRSEKWEIRLLQQRAEMDDLTKLNNIRYFRQMAAQRIEDARERLLPMTLLMIDVDNFKTYNDRFGHEAGNLALQALSETLLTLARSDDLLARYGGEEFILLMTIRESAALSAAERIRTRVAALCAPENDPRLSRQITVSIGMASLTDSSGSLEELIDAADRALYSAKKNGRNCVSVAPIKLTAPIMVS